MCSQKPRYYTLPISANGLENKKKLQVNLEAYFNDLKNYHMQ